MHKHADDKPGPRQRTRDKSQGAGARGGTPSPRRSKGTGQRTRRRPRRRQRRIGRFRLLALLLITTLLAAGAGYAWLTRRYARQAGPGPGGAVRLSLDDIEGTLELAAALHKAGAVAQPWFWWLMVELDRRTPVLKLGSVHLRDDMSPRAIAARVLQGYEPVPVRVTLPEGLTRFAIAERLAAWGVCERAAFLAASAAATPPVQGGRAARSIEGFLFPDTYHFMAPSPAPAVVRTMVQNWRRRVLPLVETHADALAQHRENLGWGLYEVTILASIIEKEAVLKREQPLIAGVFVNRLLRPSFQPKRLQTDPTVRYGCIDRPSLPSCHAGRAITKAMLADAQNPYNTYRHEGLPPGPISNPGLSALTAALRPAKHDYLYFVAQGGGRHHFSRTFAEHKRATARWRQR